MECVEAEWQAHDRILRLYVDRTSGSGIDLDGCVVASKLLVDQQELDDLVKGPYTLEVSSPGVERPLRRASHFRQSIGENIAVNLDRKIGDRKRATGRLLAVNEATEGETQVSLETEEGVWSFPIESVQKAHVVFDWTTAN